MTDWNASAAAGLEPAALEVLPHTKPSAPIREVECALSQAISLKRIADAVERLAIHFTPPPGREVGGFSQAEGNVSDILADRLHDLASNIRSNT